MTFEKENLFEEALIERLSHKGWEAQTINFPTEADLLHNWANILFENNRGIDKLNDTPLTNGEMQQIMEQITALRTPLNLNGFINGKTVTIERDNPADTLHMGKEVSLKIYDRQEIAAGQSRYQIARQPKFARRVPLLNDRRGDLMLLINGMPVIHIELKRSGIPVSRAYNQIEKYAHEGIFTGIFALIQIFVAMEPSETLYFANPGPDGRFNRDYYFHWADFNNEPINDWEKIAHSLLSIPMAHQLIGFYTVADDADGILKVMRSYQYYAANKISDAVSKRDWTRKDQHGGYIWHTTGSGKTMTSFKSAQLIANSRDADKVVFLVDRIELGTQSLAEYRAFADDGDEVQATENTAVLISKLKSSAPSDVLIVTSIQKMSNIREGEGSLKAHDIALMTAKRIVFIVDEAHRSTFGDMLRVIKDTFYNAYFFGFTGTPIMDENQKKHNMTSDVFGDELHRYSIADGIRDKNVLGFDPYKVLTYKDKALRRAVALEKAKAETEAEAIGDRKKSEIFYHYMDAAKVPMAGYVADSGQYIKGIEDELPHGQYERSQHQDKVVEDILSNWVQLSHNGKFHALFATASIPEAIVYFRLLKHRAPQLKISALFDPNIDNDGGETDQSKEERQARALFKEDGLLEIMQDYNARYQQNFDMAAHARFKKDMANRLAHKEPYTRLDRTPDQQLDILIVVDQMLTGFDSKWINTLYMDKILRYESIIQAFSRTNRLFGPEKPFGTIRYYRKPHTMERYVQEAVKLYSGDKPVALFAQRLGENLTKMNDVYQEIADLFTSAGIPDFERLPDDKTERGKFAVLFKGLNEYLEAAKIQGFLWEQTHYDHLSDSLGNPEPAIDMVFTQADYLILAQRYKELSRPSEPGEPIEDVPYDIDGYLTEIDTGRIDADYMNARFEKYLRALSESDAEEALGELHKTFATLTQEEQKYANIFIHDIESGSVNIVPGKAFRDYITQYQTRAKNDQITSLCITHINVLFDHLRGNLSQLPLFPSISIPLATSLTAVNLTLSPFPSLNLCFIWLHSQPHRTYFSREDATMLNVSEIVAKTEAMFDLFNDHFYAGEMTRPAITVSPDGGRGAYGWCSIYEIWQNAGQEAYREINICAEYIDRPISEVAATMLHEMAHLYDLTHGIKDVSNNGYYHNQKFKATAEAHGLRIEHHVTYGWTVTTLSDETAEWLSQQPGMESFTASRKTLMQIKTGDSDEGGKPATTTIKGGRQTSKNRSIKYVCPHCGAIVRATRELNIVCGDCDVPFERA